MFYFLSTVVAESLVSSYCLFSYTIVNL
uniref:Uncharacterized protein n=1 Tax=Anguilla anguilla TaxID=7936 RepID=A0A0E9PV74_ANGAN